MRIVSYNILDGGEGRADPLAEVILAQRPDIVGLVEAVDGDVLERVAKRLKMDYVVAPGAAKGASALFTRYPLLESINHGLLRPGLSKSLLEATVAVPGFGSVPIGVAHLHAHARQRDEEIRLRELEIILDVFSRHRAANRPHLLIGDFNANSPVQQIDPKLTKPSTQGEWQANGGHLPRLAVEKLLAQGYTDTFHAVHPRRAAVTGTFSTQFPGQRVDYLFAWGIAPPRLRDAWIEQDRLAKYASDHFPVGVEVT